MPQQLKHSELIELNQRIGVVNRKKDDAEKELINLRQWIRGMGKKYGLDGFQFQIHQGTGEFMVERYKVVYQVKDGMNALGLLEVEWEANDA